MKQEKDIKDLLQKHFASFEAEPDRDLWSGIAAGLQGESPPRRRMVPRWTRYAAAVAASLLLLFGLIWMLREPGQVPQGQVAEEAPQVLPTPLQQSPQPDAELAREQAGETEIKEKEQAQPARRPAAVQRVAQQPPSVASQPTEGSPQTVPEPQRDRRMARPGLESMTPLHRQVAIRQQMRERLADQPAMVSPQAERPARKRPQPAAEQAPSNAVATTGKRNALDLNQLTLANAVNFASNELSKWASSPVEIYTEETPDREVRTYEFDLLNLRVTRKVHRKN